MKSQLANSNLAEYSYYPTIMSELGFSSINPSVCPRFPAYSVGHSSFSAQQNPNGFGPRVPLGPSMGFPRGPPPQFPLRYGQVIPIRGEQVYNPASGEPVINDDPSEVSDQGKGAILGKYRKTKGVGRRKKKGAS